MSSLPVDAFGATRTVELSLPEELPYQLIYRMRREQPFAVAEPAGVEFRYATSLVQFAGLAGALRRRVSAPELLRAALRIAAGRRFYCVLRQGRILHHGWANVAFCRHYKVGPGEVVIGPIWSAPESRGMGLATYATQSAINRLIAEGLTVFYIDTSNENLACQAMIAKCGFGTAMGCTPRRPD